MYVSNLLSLILCSPVFTTTPLFGQSILLPLFSCSSCSTEQALLQFDYFFTTPALTLSLSLSQVKIFRFITSEPCLAPAFFIHHRSITKSIIIHHTNGKNPWLSHLSLFTMIDVLFIKLIFLHVFLFSSVLMSSLLSQRPLSNASIIFYIVFISVFVACLGFLQWAVNYIVVRGGCSGWQRIVSYVLFYGGSSTRRLP